MWQGAKEDSKDSVCVGDHSSGYIETKTLLSPFGRGADSVCGGGSGGSRGLGWKATRQGLEAL